MADRPDGRPCRADRTPARRRTSRRRCGIARLRASKSIRARVAPGRALRRDARRRTPTATLSSSKPSRAAPPRSSSKTRAPALPRGATIVTRPRFAARALGAGGSVLRRSVACARRHRRHRNQRQDDDDAHDRARSSRRPAYACGIDRHGRRRVRRAHAGRSRTRRRCRPNCTRCSREMRDAGARGGRDGGELARARARPRRRRALSRRGAHERHARSSRLSSRRCEATPRRSGGSSTCAAERRAQRRRSHGARDGRANCASRGRASRRYGERERCDARRRASCRTTPDGSRFVARRHAIRSTLRCRAVSTSPTRSRRSVSRARSASTTRRAHAGSLQLERVPGRMERLARRRHRRRSSTTRTRPTRSNTRSARAARDDAGVAVRSSSAAAAIATGASARRWARSRRASPTGVYVTNDNPRTRRSAGDRRRDRRRHRRARARRRARSPRARSNAPSPRRSRATSSWSPERATRPIKSSAATRLEFDDAAVVARSALQLRAAR